MRIHCLQHVDYEYLTNIELWAKNKGHSVSKTILYKGHKLPDLSSFDWLIVLGGPMSVYEEKKYPWLIAEKKFIAHAIESKKLILGICLGAQLIADVLGAKVRKNQYTQLGWHPVSLTKEAKQSPVFDGLPEQFTPFFWHKYTFDIPSECKWIAKSDGCPNQAFEYNERVVGLQFHIEPSAESIDRSIHCCGDMIGQGRYMQSPEEMRDNKTNLRKLYSIMNLLLDNMEKVGKDSSFT